MKNIDIVIVSTITLSILYIHYKYRLMAITSTLGDLLTTTKNIDN